MKIRQWCWVLLGVVCFGWSAGWTEPLPSKQIEVSESESKGSKAPKPNVSLTMMTPEMASIEVGSGSKNREEPTLTETTNRVSVRSTLSDGLGSSVQLAEVVGLFYDLKKDSDGEPSEIGKAVERKRDSRADERAVNVISEFIRSDFNQKNMDEFFKAPRRMFAISISIPPSSPSATAEFFRVEQEEKMKDGRYWLCHYEGQIKAPEDGRYRFCGFGDDILVVKVENKVVLDASRPELIGKLTYWESTDENSRKYPMNGYKYGTFSDDRWNKIYAQITRDGAYKRNGKTFEKVLNKVGISRVKNNSEYMSVVSRMVIGDWVDLKQSQSVKLDFLIGEMAGDDFSCRLLIQQEGKSYRMVQSDAGLRPVLPIFKMNDVIQPELIELMELDPNEMTLEGPIFGAGAGPMK